MEFCPEDPKSQVEHKLSNFAKLPVCINCKMTGIPSKGAQATHALTPIKDADNQAFRMN
jgi:hypothetical protein